MTLKTLSILGDSVSTYKGISNDTSAHPTLFYNPFFYKPSFPKEKTYWWRVMEHFGLTLCVNNSWSGGNLSGRDNPDTGVNRAAYLTKADGTAPDLIIVFMGINDLGRGVPLSIFAEDYRRALLTVRDKHPNAKVCCVNLPDRYEDFKARTEQFNDAIAAAAEEAGENFFVADLFHSRLNNDFYYINTVDGLHPDEDGMKVIAEVVIEAVKNNC